MPQYHKVPSCGEMRSLQIHTTAKVVAFVSSTFVYRAMLCDIQEDKTALS